MSEVLELVERTSRTAVSVSICSWTAVKTSWSMDVCDIVAGASYSSRRNGLVVVVVLRCRC